jgi:hypothetical protein
MVGLPTNVNVIEPVLSKLLSGIDDESIKTSFSEITSHSEKNLLFILSIAVFPGSRPK